MPRLTEGERLDYQPSTLAIYCGAPSCVDSSGQDLAVLETFVEGGFEVWRLAGGGIRQTLASRADASQLDQATIEQRGWAAHRVLVHCDSCGHHLTFGDLLGVGAQTAAQRVGRRGKHRSVPVPDLVAIEEARSEDHTIFVSPARLAFSEALSRVSAVGVSRLPMTALERIVALS